MTYEDLDAGDETRRFGDYVAFPHGEDAGTSLDDAPIAQGRPVDYDGTELSEVTDSANAIAGILSNYDVYGDTGKEELGEEANVKMRGECLADLSGLDSTPSEGDYLGENGEVFVVEEVTDHPEDDIFRVQVR